MKNLILLTTALTSVTSTGHASEPPVIENAGDTINSEWHEAFSTITADGLTLYVSSDRPSDMGGGEPGGFYLFSNYNIYVSHRADTAAPWSPLTMLPAPINSPSTDHSPYLSEDGLSLYFMSDRPGGSGQGDLYVSHRTDPADDAGWGPAINLEPDINGPFVESCPTVVETDGTLHLFYIQISGRPDALPDFMTSDWDPDRQAFALPRKISISTPQGDSHLEPEKGLIWGMDWPGGQGGSDIWQTSYAPQNGDYASGWTQPVNLGDWINTEHEEIMPSPTADGSLLIFQSDRPGGIGGMDIYFAHSPDYPLTEP
ncbi:PD40 domain-containing protein [Pseudoruegeria sp. HB172150]|uniref:PD40 domain-containing protein n=1 Tax=Pseudoruegeria sp. HB172150 TaxID=2721164 RepID=UPI001557D6F5|nr:PD40 domain-containing protein [Pseudoruegeria sp. HB172150]